jgi:hypothetical protein
MAQDKVMRPKQETRKGGIPTPKSGIIEGPTPSSANLQPFNRTKKK